LYLIYEILYPVMFMLCDLCLLAC